MGLAPCPCVCVLFPRLCTVCGFAISTSSIAILWTLLVQMEIDQSYGIFLFDTRSLDFSLQCFLFPSGPPSFSCNSCRDWKLQRMTHECVFLCCGCSFVALFVCCWWWKEAGVGAQGAGCYIFCQMSSAYLKPCVKGSHGCMSVGFFD